MEQLRQERLRWEDQWIDIRNYELPFIGDFKRQGDDSYPGRRRDLHIAQGVAWASCQVFAAGIMSGLTPPSRQWFKFQFNNSELNENVQAGKVLDERQDIMQSVLAGSNFYNAVHSSYFELPYGQALLAVFPDTQKGVRFQAQAVGTYYIDVGGDGKVNTFCRRYPMKLQQIIDTFGVEALPYNERVRLAGGAVPDNVTRYVWWLVQPNAQAVPGKIGRLNMPFISMYWIDGSGPDDWLYVGGFEEFPVPCGRYMTNANNPYGYGPGWYALGDSKSLQVMKRDYLTAVELSVKPPLTATADVMAEGINLIPGGVTKLPAPNSAVQQLFQVGLDMPHLAEEIIRTEDAIKRAYSADLFLMPDADFGADVQHPGPRRRIPADSAGHRHAGGRSGCKNPVHIAAGPGAADVRAGEHRAGDQLHGADGTVLAGRAEGHRSAGDHFALHGYAGSAGQDEAA